MKRKIWLFLFVIIIVSSLYLVFNLDLFEFGTKVPGVNKPGIENSSVRVVLNNDVDFKGNDLNDNVYANYIRQKTGINIRYESINASREQYNHKLSLLMQSNSLPDAVLIYDRNQYMRYVEKGILLPINQNIWKYDNLNRYISSSAWDMTKVNGIAYAVPMERYDPAPLVVHVRRDWLENLGLKVPETIEEFEAVLRAFTHKDPDGNGIHDTYGLLLGDDLVTGQSMERGMLFSDYFDAGKFSLKDGSVIPPAISEGYRDFLKFMDRLYKEGVIPEDFAVLKFPQYMEKLRSGKYGMTVFYWMGRDMFSDSSPESAWIAIKPPAGKSGRPGTILWDKPVRQYIVITKQCKDPDKVLKILDWALSNEGDMVSKLGIEGLDYNVINGRIAYKTERRSLNEWKFINLLVERGVTDTNIRDNIKEYWGEMRLKRFDVAKETGSVDKIAAMLPFFNDINNADFKRVTSEYTKKAIMGTVDIDSTWSRYVEDWKIYGGDKFIELLTDWYHKSYIR